MTTLTVSRPGKIGFHVNYQRHVFSSMAELANYATGFKTFLAQSDVVAVSDIVDWSVYGRNQLLRAPYALKVTTHDVNGKRTYSNVDESVLKILGEGECLRSMSTMTATHTSVICCPDTELQTRPKETGLGMSDKLSSPGSHNVDVVETARDYFKFAGLVKSIFGFEHGWTIFTTYVARSDYYNENADKVEKLVAFTIQ